MVFLFHFLSIHMPYFYLQLEHYGRLLSAIQKEDDGQFG